MKYNSLFDEAKISFVSSKNNSIYLKNEDVVIYLNNDIDFDDLPRASYSVGLLNIHKVKVDEVLVSIEKLVEEHFFEDGGGTILFFDVEENKLSMVIEWSIYATAKAPHSITQKYYEITYDELEIKKINETKVGEWKNL